jgi:hypothetical protein
MPRISIRITNHHQTNTDRNIQQDLHLRHP